MTLPPNALTSAVTTAIVPMPLLFITGSSFVKLDGTSNHLDDDLALCAPRFEVSPSLFGGFEREDPIHDRPDAARFNEGCDLAQLLAVRSYENKRVANAVAPGLLADAEAQKAHDLLQEPVRPVLLSERYIRRTGDGNELSTGLQHLEGLVERVRAQTVQDDVVAAQDLLEILFLVVDDDLSCNGVVEL